ncbi:aldo/keto reductase [Naasia sp. SYSU D00948]|uniref:aldo/keto reductase n=1 Tax=Naasia sp. SYSU D00948 TaxID=2817379 RepID=UPI001B311FE1|nr:aldo/keto reductase [Naasia sp. SYSU D00948]
MQTSLPVARLGRTDMEITRVGFGAWALGGTEGANSWGPQDDEVSIAAIHHAVERGINWIDTAAIYGTGHSEEVVGRALQDLPAADRPLVFTKGGLVWDEENRRAASKRVGDPESIRTRVEDSLRRLQVDRIDLYQMHWPAEDGTPVEEYWQAFVELRESGKVRAIGLSNHGVEQLEAAEAVGHVDTLQPPFSAIRQETAEDLLPWCAEHETGVIVYSPMGSGLLTGAFTRERVESLAENDWRRRSPDFTTNLDRNLAVAAALAEVGEKHGVSAAAAAVAWTLGFPGVTGAIVGARSPEQIDGWLPAASLQLTEDDYARVEQARQSA